MVEQTRTNLHAVIMAGGKGMRFWPMSTRYRPKPFIKEFMGQSLFRMTIDRIRNRLSPEQIWLVLGEHHVDLLYHEAPEIRPDRLLVEPASRDTAAAITFAAFAIRAAAGPKAVMLVMPCDHYIHPTTRFWSDIDTATAILQTHPETLVVLGIPPTRPDINYGYIETGKAKNVGDARYHTVRSFTEKPDYERACHYLSHGGYLWNAGIFVWRCDRILQLVHTYLPKTYAIFKTAYENQDTAEFSMVLNQCYQDLEPISIDYGIMEKAHPVTVIEASFQWDDIGQWEALDRVLLKNDDKNNRSIGRVVVLDSHNTTAISNSGVIAVLGLDDIVVVQDHGRVLVMRKGRGCDLKTLVGSLPSEWIDS